MGREVRRVPKDWRHPMNPGGVDNFKPLHDHYSQKLRDWNEGREKWEAGLVRDYSVHPEVGWRVKTGKFAHDSWEEYYGPQPKAENYMPDWPDAERTHYQMYETTTEGTPISPVFATPEELARWLVDNEASAFAGQTASYEAWLLVCQDGWAPSAVMKSGVLTSGVEGMRGDPSPLSSTDK